MSTPHNAVKYTPDRGMIQVAAQLRDDAKSVEVSVTDTGIGIPEADRLRVEAAISHATPGRSTSADWPAARRARPEGPPGTLSFNSSP